MQCVKASFITLKYSIFVNRLTTSLVITAKLSGAAR